MPQEVSSRPLKPEVRVSCLASPCEICGGRSGIGTGFCRGASVFVNIIPSQLHTQSTIPVYYSYKEDKDVKPGNL
jgi:hypothetical protein